MSSWQNTFEAVNWIYLEKVNRKRIRAKICFSLPLLVCEGHPSSASGFRKSTLPYNCESNCNLQRVRCCSKKTDVT